MIITAWFDVFCTCLITLFYYLGFFWAAYVMTFLLGILAAIYSPAKYGYIKELVGKEKLAAANGVVQACTTIAILAGIFVIPSCLKARWPALHMRINPDCCRPLLP
jgi:hypothetical protein